MDHLKRNLKRLEQRTAQTVGRAERTADLTEAEEELRARVERMLTALHTTSKPLAALHSKGSKGETLEKRRQKSEDFSLIAGLSNASNILSQDPNSLLRHILQHYGTALDQILNQQVECDREIEERVLPELSKYEPKGLKALREKLNRAVLDMDSAKRRLASNREPEKIEHIQEELDAAESKVDECRDKLVIDLHHLSGKELQMAHSFAQMAKIQLEYYRSSAEILERITPAMVELVDNYPRRPVFAAPLEDHLRYSGRRIALPLEVCCSALTELGLRDEGLFRVSGNSRKLEKLKAALDAGTVDLSEYDRDPHSVAGTLKAYLRDLQEPLTTSSLLPQWRQAAVAEGAERTRAIQVCLSQLPPPNYHNLAYLIRFLASVAALSDVNKMTASNLAIVFGPNLFSGTDQSDTFIGSRIVETMIKEADLLFPEEIRFTSSLIGSLHDRSGGFTVPHGPVVGLNTQSRHSPPQGHAQKAPSPSPAPHGRLSPASSAHRNSERHPSKRPKAPAPPPPPPPNNNNSTLRSNSQQHSPNPTPVSLYPNPHSIMQSSEPSLFSECGQSGPPSKASSAADSLNEYGAEEMSTFATMSSGYSSSAAYQNPPLPLMEKSTPLLAPAESLEDLHQTSMPPPPRPPPQSGHGHGHRKTASLDQGVLNPNGVEPLPSRPPPPPPDVLQRRSSQRRSMVEVGGGGGGGAPEPLPRRTLSRPINVGLPPSPSAVASNGPPKAAATRISVEEATSPDSPSKPKPPLPAKPKLNPEMTHL